MKEWRLIVQYKNDTINPDLEWMEECFLNVTPEECIEKFNCGLRPGEKARQLIAAIPINKNKSYKPHSWKKQSLVTERCGYDRYRCRECGVFGKRHGLNSFVVPDKKGPCKG